MNTSKSEIKNVYAQKPQPKRFIFTFNASIQKIFTTGNPKKLEKNLRKLGVSGKVTSLS